MDQIVELVFGLLFFPLELLDLILSRRLFLAAAVSVAALLAVAAVRYQRCPHCGGLVRRGLREWRQSYAFPSIGGVPGWLFSYGYWAAMLLLALDGLRCRCASVRELVPLLLWAALFVAAYAVTGYDVPRHGAGQGFVNFRFFAPLHLVLLVLAAVGVAALPSRAIVMAGLGGLGLLGQATLLSPHVPEHLTAYRGYSYVQLGQVWAARLYRRSETFAEAAGVLARFPESARGFIYVGLFDNVQDRWPDPVATLARIGEVPPPYRDVAVEALAGTVARLRAADPDRMASIAHARPLSERDHLYRGYASALAATWRPALDWRGDFDRQPPAFRRWYDAKLGALAAEGCFDGPPGDCADVRRRIDTLAAERRAWAYRGMGQVAGYNFLGVFVLDERRITGGPLPEVHRPHFHWGVGWAIRETFSEDPLRALDWIARLPANDRAAALDGARAFEAWQRFPSTESVGRRL